MAKEPTQPTGPKPEPPPPSPSPCAGAQFLIELDKAGLIPHATRRMVIDIHIDRFVTVYYESYPSEDLVECALKAGVVLEAIEIAKLKAIDEQE